MSGPPSPASQLRGLAAGSLTAALAAVAHGAAGGAIPSGATTAELGLLAVTVGALSATIVGASGSGCRWHCCQRASCSATSCWGPSATTTETPRARRPRRWVTRAPDRHHLRAALIATAGYLCSALSRAVRRPIPRVPSGHCHAHDRIPGRRSAVAFRTSACRVDVASGAAGRRNSLTDHPFRHTEGNNSK